MAPDPPQRSGGPGAPLDSLPGAWLTRGWRRPGRRPPGTGPGCDCSRRGSPALHQAVARFHQGLTLVHHRVDLAGEDDGVVDGGRLVHPGVPGALVVHGPARVHGLEELLAVEPTGGGLVGRELHNRKLTNCAPWGSRRCGSRRRDIIELRIRYLHGSPVSMASVVHR